MPSLEKDCAGQERLVRDLKSKLDIVFEKADSKESIVLAKDAAFNLAVELEAFGLICDRCTKIGGD